MIFGRIPDWCRSRPGLGLFTAFLILAAAAVAAAGAAAGAGAVAGAGVAAGAGAGAGQGAGAQAATGLYEVVAAEAKIRSHPAPEAKVIGRLQKGERVRGRVLESGYVQTRQGFVSVDELQTVTRARRLTGGSEAHWMVSGGLSMGGDSQGHTSTTIQITPQYYFSNRSSGLLGLTAGFSSSYWRAGLAPEFRLHYPGESLSPFVGAGYTYDYFNFYDAQFSNRSFSGPMLTGGVSYQTGGAVITLSGQYVFYNLTDAAVKNQFFWGISYGIGI